MYRVLCIVLPICLYCHKYQNVRVAPMLYVAARCAGRDGLAQDTVKQLVDDIDEVDGINQEQRVGDDEEDERHSDDTVFVAKAFTGYEAQEKGREQ